MIPEDTDEEEAVLDPQSLAPGAYIRRNPEGGSYIHVQISGRTRRRAGAVRRLVRPHFTGGLCHSG